MDEVLNKLFQMYEKTPVLVAAYDGFDRLRYANHAFRSAFFIEPEETPFWSELMARIDDMLQRRDSKDAVLGCLGVLDIDSFKSVNDRFGHQVGDLILRDFARRI